MPFLKTEIGRCDHSEEEVVPCWVRSNDLVLLGACAFDLVLQRITQLRSPIVFKNNFPVKNKTVIFFQVRVCPNSGPGCLWDVMRGRNHKTWGVVPREVRTQGAVSRGR